MPQSQPSLGSAGLKRPRLGSRSTSIRASSTNHSTGLGPPCIHRERCVASRSRWTPPTGYALNVLFLSWLYAYYCYDYKWGLQGVRLTERLAYFERRWAFFAGKVVCLPACLPA